MDLIKGNDSRLKEMCPEFKFDTGYIMEDGTVLQAKELYERRKNEMVMEAVTKNMEKKNKKKNNENFYFKVMDSMEENIQRNI